MLRIEFAHLRAQATNGQVVDFAIFHAEPTVNSDSARRASLNELVVAARQVGRKVDAAALVYEEGGYIKWWGDNFAVDWINKNGVPSPNHWVQF